MRSRASWFDARTDRATSFGVEQHFADTLGFNNFHAERRHWYWDYWDDHAADCIQWTVVRVVIFGRLLRDALFLRAAIHVTAGEQVVDRHLRRCGRFLIIGVARN